MDEQLSPMNPDDLQALLEFAGPMFNESKIIEQMTSDDNNPVVGGHKEDGSFKIKQGLIEAERLVRQRTPVYVPHVPQEQIPVSPIQNYFSSPPVVNNNEQQLEFSFNEPKGLEITNKHLQDISLYLKKILTHLQEDSKVSKAKDIIKLTTSGNK